MTNEERAKRFKRARKSRFKTLEEASAAMNVPVTTLWKLETPTQDTAVSYLTVLAIADACHVSVAWLCGQTDTPAIEEDSQITTATTGLTADSVCILRRLKKAGMIQSVDSIIGSPHFFEIIYNISTAQGISERSRQAKEIADIIDSLTQAGLNSGMSSENGRFSDREMIDMYIWKATTEFETMLREIIKKGEK